MFSKKDNDELFRQNLSGMFNSSGYILALIVRIALNSAISLKTEGGLEYFSFWISNYSN